MKIVVMGGSFNPPTLAHSRLLLAAVEAVGADRGIFVPSSNAYVRKKMTRAGHPEETVPEETRLRMLEAMAEEDYRLKVSDLEYRRTEKAYTYETMLDLSAEYPEGTTFYFLAGGDKVSVFPRWHRIEEFLDRFSIIVVRRDGEDPLEEIERNAFLRARRDRFVSIDAPEGIDEISSSAVRDAVRTGDLSVSSLCHPRVWELYLAWKAENPINEFSGEYRFLSNFWEAPVTYGGVTYGSNEAAFQAQKCIEAEKRLAFTELTPSKAKSLGRRVLLRSDWEDVKIGLMEEIVRAKFTQTPDLGEKLLQTGYRQLVEGNTWNDTFWGVSLKSLKGQNHLGKILMQIREELRSGT